MLGAKQQLLVMSRSTPSTRTQVEAEADRHLEEDEVVGLEIETSNNNQKTSPAIQVEEASLEVGGAREAMEDGKGTSKQIVAWNAIIVESQGIWQGAATRNKMT
ncbi:hypothetical protein [Escherichia coli]|uniref:hypothetical protein n=1 Tax=Escherichia coli TaxID=562 RepID=UPI002574E69B|nr:hypothetical protein [Escherichia coli]MDM1593383.1 hypothetical protein [Escherichia coli]